MLRALSPAVPPVLIVQHIPSGFTARYAARLDAIGPLRVCEARDDQPLLPGAIFAENIPIPETRDYVKRVLANATVYAAILSGKPQSLKARLGDVGSPDAMLASNQGNRP